MKDFNNFDLKKKLIFVFVDLVMYFDMFVIFKLNEISKTLIITIVVKPDTQ